MEAVVVPTDRHESASSVTRACVSGSATLVSSPHAASTAGGSSHSSGKTALDDAKGRKFLGKRVSFLTLRLNFRGKGALGAGQRAFFLGKTARDDAKGRNLLGNGFDFRGRTTLEGCLHEHDPSLLLRSGACSRGPILLPTPSREPTESESSRTVIVKHPGYAWNVDLTLMPTRAGFWVPWLPSASRRVIGFAVFEKQQFGAAFREWCELDCRHRAVHANLEIGGAASCARALATRRDVRLYGALHRLVQRMSATSGPRWSDSVRGSQPCRSCESAAASRASGSLPPPRLCALRLTCRSHAVSTI